MIIAAVPVILLSVNNKPEQDSSSGVPENKADTVSSAADNTSSDDGRITPPAIGGENAVYSLDGDGLLTITGTGKITNISEKDNSWGKGGIKDLIRSVVISPGVTSIGDNVFTDCKYLTSVTIPNSVTKISVTAFWGLERDYVTFICRSGSEAESYAKIHNFKYEIIS